MTIRWSLIGAMLWAQSSYAADISFTCERLINSVRTQCQYNPGNALVISETFEAEVLINYKYLGCDGVYAKANSLLLDARMFSGNQVSGNMLVYNGEGTVTAIGTKTFGIKDISGRLPYTKHPESCHVRLEVQAIFATEKTLASWRSDLNSLNSQIETLEGSIEGWQSALNHYAVQKALSDVADSMHKDLTDPDLLRVREGAFLSGKALLESLGSSECGTYTDEERSALAHTVSALFVLQDPSKWQNEDGSPKKLADYFSEKDRDLLKIVGAEQSPDLDKDYQKEIDAARTLVGSLRARISEIEIMMKSYAKK